MAQRASELQRARSAAERGSWAEAYDRFRAVGEAALSPDDLERLAESAWWLSRLDEAIAIRQRAYSGHVAAGANRRAGYVAWLLSYDYLFKRQAAVSTGWVKRAQRHLRAEPDSVEQGFLALAEADVAERRGSREEARAHAERAAEAGRRLGAPELAAMGIQKVGRLLIAAGRVSEGIELLDEAMSFVVAGDMAPFFTGWIYCNVLSACLEIADLKRAGEWTEAARAWCRSLPPRAPDRGWCRLYRAEVLSLRGAWAEAEEEARGATGQLMAFEPSAASLAFYEIGEIRRRMGDLAAAEEAFIRAHELGGDPQPGLALVRLGQGRTQAAAAALKVALVEEPTGSLRRARLLAAQVEVALAAAHVDVARAAVDELQAMASRASIPILEATASMARGRLLLAEGDPAQALWSLRRACALCQDLELPYESAQARALIGLGTRDAGDEERAHLELRAARRAFERLGALADARRAAELEEQPPAAAAGITGREAQVLRLVAAGKTNREIAALLFISEHTVARHLSNIFTKFGVSSRAAATAYAFERDLV